MNRREFLKLGLAAVLLLPFVANATIAFDASSDNLDADSTWTHTPVGTPRAIIVDAALIIGGAGQLSGCTYGGVAMTEVSGSPLIKASGETVVLQQFFLGSNIPTGAQTVTCTGSGVTQTVAVSLSYTASFDTVVVDTSTLSSDADLTPDVTVSLNGRSSAVSLVYMSGEDDPATTTPLASWTAGELDFGSQTGGIFLYDTIGTADVTAGWDQNDGSADDAAMIGIAISEVLSEQEGFRWGVDDGNEAAHTFEANQDTNITLPDGQSRLLRVLVNANGDPPSTAYTLRYQKNGTGGYVAVPVGSTTNGSISNQNVAASADDAQQSGATVTINGTTIGASLDATTEYAGMRFTNITIPKGSTITSAQVELVPSGTGEDEPLVTVYLQAADDCAAFTTTNNDITSRSLTTGTAWSSTDLGASGSSYHATPSLVTDFQAVIDRAGWASGNDVCVIIQGGSTTTRDLTIEAQDLGPNTNPPRLDVSWTFPNEVYVTVSANIAAGGEATTARLTAPSGKTTGDFDAGRRWDDENGTDTTDITSANYSEFEWLPALASSLTNGDFIDFRVYAGSVALEANPVTPRWTVGSGAATIIPQVRYYQRMQRMNQ